MTNLKIFCFILISYFTKEINSQIILKDNCVKCNGDGNLISSDTNKIICNKGNQYSYWIDDNCVYNAYSDLKLLFVTGEVFNLGAGSAVQTQVSKNCFNEISLNVIENLSNNPDEYNDDTMCLLSPNNTPCLYSSYQFIINSQGYDCSKLI